MSCYGNMGAVIASPALPEGRALLISGPVELRRGESINALALRLARERRAVAIDLGPPHALDEADRP